MTRRAARLLAAGMLLACNPRQGSGSGPVGPPDLPYELGEVDDPEGEPSVEPREPREPPRVLTEPGSGVFVVWAGAAARAAVAGEDLLILEPDLRHMSAIDWRDGEAQWRIELPFSPAVSMYGLEGRVLMHDHDQAVVVESARGRVLGRNQAPVDAQGPRAHGVDRSRGACAWLGPCGIRAFDCDDGSPRGPYFASPEIHLYGTSDDPSEHSTSCVPEPKLLGRHQGLIVLMAVAPGPDRLDATGEPTPSMMGIDVARGQLQWQTPLTSAYSPLGITDDGGCWWLDEQAPRLAVHDCLDGALRWERAIGPGQLEVQAVGEYLVVARLSGGRWRLTAYAIGDGSVGWTSRLAKRQRPVLPGGAIPQAQVTGTRRVYALIDPEAGGVSGELVAGRDERLWLDPGGGFVLIGRDLREVDETGHLTRQRPFTGTRVHSITAGHVLTHDGETIEVYDRDQLRERARVEGRMSIEPRAGLPEDRLLLRRHGEDGVALVLGLEPPSRRR